MSNDAYDALLDALLGSWARNNTILVNLLHAIPEGALELRPTSTSPTSGRQTNDARRNANA